MRPCLAPCHLVNKSLMRCKPSSRSLAENLGVTLVASPSSEIRKHCSKESDYITGETPVTEAIFRVFLANGNQPIEADGIME